MLPVNVLPPASAAVQALVAMVGYLVARAPSAFMLTLATFVIALIPILGAGGFSFMVAVALALSGHPATGIFLRKQGIDPLGSAVGQASRTLQNKLER